MQDEGGSRKRTFSWIMKGWGAHSRWLSNCGPRGCVCQARAISGDHRALLSMHTCHDVTGGTGRRLRSLLANMTSEPTVL